MSNLLSSPLTWCWVEVSGDFGWEDISYTGSLGRCFANDALYAARIIQTLTYGLV